MYSIKERVKAYLEIKDNEENEDNSEKENSNY